jgi:Glycoside hydrolase family 44
MDRFVRLFLVSLLFATVLSIPACNGGSSGTGGTNQNPTTPAVAVTPASSSITTAQSLGVTIAVSGTSGTPTGSVVLSSGGYTSSAATLNAGSATIAIPAGSLAAGSETLTGKFTPDSASSAAYNGASGTANVTVTQSVKAPTVTVTPEETTHPYAENLIVTATVKDGSVSPSGRVTLSSGSFTSSAVTLNSGAATFYVQPGSLAKGSDTLTVTYTPDSSSSASYAMSTGTASMTITSPGITNVTVNINTLANRHQISPYIYGINTLNSSDITNLSPGFVRFGGNEASDYNWKLFTYNAGGDWFFEDFGLNDSNGKGIDSVAMTHYAVNAGSQMLTTMPMLGWVAKEPENGTNHNWSFSVATYGAQCKTDPNNSDAGNGQKPDCQTPITSNASTNAYYPLVDTSSDCTTGNCLYRNEWATALATAFGRGTCNVPYSSITSCHFYDMDNEPEIWDGSHRDIHPNHPGYSELSNLFETEGTALKTWDPSAVRFGPITCCWNFLWSAGPSGDDKNAHAGIDYLPWWLNQINWLDKINGARTLDVFDVHSYVGAKVSTTGYTNAQLRAAAGMVYRTYWDPTYYNSGYDADWITTTQPNRGVTFLIPRLKALVNATYPGTPLSFSEWESWMAPQSEWDFSTALSDADAFGVMGREGLSFSTRWGGPSETDGTTNQPHPNYQSFKLYTNCDGAKHGFGTLSVSDQTTMNPDLFVSYAALDATGTTMTIMVLNKDPGNAANVTFNLNGFSASTYTAYTLASTNPGSITASAASAWSATQSFAANSITLLVVGGSQSSKPASEWFLNPDDLMIPASGMGLLNPKIVSGTAPVTLTSALFDVFEGATACSGSLMLADPTITPTKPATITVNPGSTPGFCHYTVTGNDGTSTQTEGGWIVVGKPAATLTQSGNNQSGSAGTALSQPLTVTLTLGQSGGSASGAGILFSTSAGTLSNGTTTGSSVIAQTKSSGIASVTLTLPSTKETVTVTAQDQFALGGASVTFTEIAN